MTTTAQALIEAAFARSTASDAGKLAVDGEMINHLNRKYQAMFGMMGLFQRSNVMAKSTVTFSGSPATATLPTDIANITRVDLNSDGSRVYLVPVEEKDRTYHLKPAAFRQGLSLVSCGRSGDPVAGDVWALYYQDAPATLTALSSTLDARFPVRFETVLILDLAVYLSIKDEGRSPAAMGALKSELNDEWSMFKEMIGASNTAVESAQPKVSAGTQGNGAA